MNILIKGKHENFVIPFKSHERDFCYDCVAVSKTYIDDNRIQYGLGFSLEIDTEDPMHESMKDDFIFSFDLRPRSSIHKTGLILSNSIGTGDEDYRGEYAVVFYNFDKSLPEYEIGDKVCQLKVGFTPIIKFTETKDLTITDRGAGGFGSTGK